MVIIQKKKLEHLCPFVRILNDLIGAEGESLSKLMRIVVEVAIDVEGDDLYTLKRVGTVEVEFHLDKECCSVELLTGDIWLDIHPRICYSVDVAVSDDRW